MIPLIPYGKHYLDQDDVRAVVDVINGSHLTQGPAVGDFEKAVADYVGAKYAVAVSSGTAALHLASIAAGVKPDTTYITSPITFVASANAGLYAGANVKFVDIDPETINMSIEHLKLVVKESSNVSAIVPVHFAGYPCDMSSIENIADSVGAAVIEDAAHALGASYPDGSKVGCCKNSLMTMFSFHPVKAIAAGEGGMITTNDYATYHQLLRLRSHGINKEEDSLVYPNQRDVNGIQAQWYYEMQELGFNYRLTDIQSALGLSQLSKLDAYLDKRKRLVSIYDQDFSELQYCKPIQIDGRKQSAHHIYVLRVDFSAIGISRQLFMKKLFDKGIGSQVHYMPVPIQPYYQKLGFLPEDYKQSMGYYEQAISLPLYYSLKESEQQFVIDSIRELIL